MCVSECWNSLFFGIECYFYFQCSHTAGEESFLFINSCFYKPASPALVICSCWKCIPKSFLSVHRYFWLFFNAPQVKHENVLLFTVPRDATVIKRSRLSVGVWNNSCFKHLIGIQEDKVHCGPAGLECQDNCHVPLPTDHRRKLWWSVGRGLFSTI